MSNIISAIAQRKVVGSGARKSILMHLANFASDDGSGIWASKSNMASDLELTKRTVQKTIKDFIEMGILFEVGKKSCLRGFTVEYRIDLDALNALKCTRELSSRVNSVRPTRELSSPLGVNSVRPNQNITTIEPNIKKYIKKIKNTGFKSDKNLEIDKGAEKKRKPTEFPSKLINHNKLSFEDFWKVYPKRNGVKLNKAKAEIQYKKAIKQIDPEKLIERARIYRRASNGFPVDAFRWLRDSCWKDFEEQRVQTNNQRRYKKIIAGYSQ